MHISWLGNTAVRIQVKPFDKDVDVVIDTYRPKTGEFPRNLSTDIGLFTHGAADSITLSGNPFILDTPGECETKAVLITAVQGHEDGQIMFRLDAEHLSLAHLGLIDKPLTDQQLETLSDVDILLVPVGGKNCYDAEAAAKAVNAIEPRIVIPIAYKSDNNPDFEPVEKFLKEMGVAGKVQAEKKTIIKNKSLPQEETQVILLSKE
ncbi:MAG: MBL fold metallo-hydrolase [Candidatus Magasanikbacteria bacterium]|nr:MBL fold metallo-hydrolase [Candidatus Magasanikbacteria bacterium]